VLYGGTNWGNTFEPTVYSSYDYGGGINENRIVTPKMPEMRMQGEVRLVVRQLHYLTMNRAIPPSLSRSSWSKPDFKRYKLYQLEFDLYD
jgi:hypothetical protein